MWLDYMLLEIERNNAIELQGFYKEGYEEIAAFWKGFEAKLKMYIFAFRFSLSFGVISFCLFAGVVTGLVTYLSLKHYGYI
jgi:hypothetical protein